MTRHIIVVCIYTCIHNVPRKESNMSSNDQNVIIMNVKKHHVLPVRPAFRCNCTRQWHSQSVKSATVLINHQLPVSWFVLFSKWFTFQGTIVVSVYFRCFSHPSSADWNSVHWRRMWETAEIYGGNKWVSLRGKSFTKRQRLLHRLPPYLEWGGGRVTSLPLVSL